MSPKLVDGVLVLPPGWDGADLAAWKRSLGEKVKPSRGKHFFAQSQKKGALKSRQSRGCQWCDKCQLFGHSARNCRR